MASILAYQATVGVLIVTDVTKNDSIRSYSVKACGKIDKAFSAGYNL